MPADTGVSVWLVCGVRGVLGIQLAEFSRAVSTPIPMRQVDGVGRLVPRDLVARPARANGCHATARTGSARFRAQVTELAPPVPKTEDSLPRVKWGADKFPGFFAGAHFPSPLGEGQGDG